MDFFIEALGLAGVFIILGFAAALDFITFLMRAGVSEGAAYICLVVAEAGEAAMAAIFVVLCRLLAVMVGRNIW